MDPAPSRHHAEPLITIFHCERCTDAALLVHHGAHCRLVPGCTATVDSPRIGDAFLEGADGVMVLGCLRVNCEQPRTDVQEFQQIHQGARELHRQGVEPARLQRLWLTPREMSRLPALVASFRRRLAVMGPRFARQAPVDQAVKVPEAMTVSHG